MPETTQDIRRTLRARRRTLSSTVQRRHCRQASRVYRASTLFLRYRRIAAYLANDGELDPSLILESALAAGKELFLPVLRHRLAQSLWFSAYHPGDRLSNNRFGIPEPDIRSHPPCPPWGLDLILMPLVGFDPQGRRIGMGGGFYDRTLAYLLQRRHWHRPLLIGLAHECQAWPALPSRSWDVPVDGILSEQRLILFRHPAIAPSGMPANGMKERA